MPSRPLNLFTIADGSPFLPTLARALIDGSLIDGFPGVGGGLALADATVYVPTQRAASALARAIVEASGRDSVILPRIAPLGAFEPDDPHLFFDPDQPEAPAEPPVAVGELARRHTLARWTRAWGKALRGAILNVAADGSLVFDRRDPALVAATPAQAYALASDLAALIDDMIIEGVDWRKLETLSPEDHDPYWGITLNFLTIAFANWPEWLAARGLVDRARRVSLTIEAEIAALAAGTSRGPTIIAGSTGANRATAALIAAVARSPQGAVVLPGLDLWLDDPAWGMVGAPEAGEGAPGHPQALLRRLMDTIGASREEVRPLGTPAAPLAARGRFLSEALRPAGSTEHWRVRDASLSADAVDAALDGVSIVAAATEAEEALAVAIAMRETLETPGRTAALITPSPAIARRVATELARWGIEVEDSAGRTLWASEAGALARLALDAAIGFSPLTAQALLSHPSVRLGRSRADLLSASRALELGVFRAAPIGALDDLETVFAEARAGAEGPNAHRATRSVDPPRREAAERLLRALRAALGALADGSARASLSDWLRRHRDTLAVLLSAPEGEDAVPPGFGAVAELMDEWAEAAGEEFPCSLPEYAELFSDALMRARAPVVAQGRPRLQILGLLEARLLTFDQVILAGLDETVWPPAVESDAFLNRPMRATLGLSAPERRIGQTAHDFVSALGAREAIISRAKKRDGAPTVASRFLQRIAAAAGAGSRALAAAEQRGDRYLRLARSVDESGPRAPIQRPEPRPPKDMRPRSLSVTRIETLRRDPYSIYAERILRLGRLEPVGRELDPRDVGTAWHSVLQDFFELHPLGPLPADARASVVALARRRFAPMLADPGFARVNWPNAEMAIDFVLAVEQRRRSDMAQSWTERSGEIEIPLRDGGSFRLSARADRIDQLRSGEAAILDYKTGSPPTQKQVLLGFAPQLTLEAAILARGGFQGVAPLNAQEGLYLKIGGADGGREVRATGDEPLAVVAEAHLAQLKLLLDQFADEATPYLSRPMPQFASRFGDYDHLARVKEWSATGEETEGDAA